MLDLTIHVGRPPPEDRSDEAGDLRRGRHTAVPSLDGDPRTPSQDIVQM
jgi:hypothetical protein